MATIPLIRNINDKYYRYLMPKLITKIEGGGRNGTRTVIINMRPIAKAINRPEAQIMRYFGLKPGSRVKTTENTFSVNGPHENQILLSHLYNFIEEFVLCPECNNPETDDFTVDKNFIKIKCRACGSGKSQNTEKLVVLDNDPDDFIEDKI